MQYGELLPTKNFTTSTLLNEVIPEQQYEEDYSYDESNQISKLQISGSEDENVAEDPVDFDDHENIAA